MVAENSGRNGNQMPLEVLLILLGVPSIALGKIDYLGMVLKQYQPQEPKKIKQREIIQPRFYIPQEVQVHPSADPKRAEYYQVPNSTKGGRRILTYQ